MDENSESQIRNYISGKNTFAVEELLKELSISEEVKSQILNTALLFGGTEIFDKAVKHVKNARSVKAVERLRELYKLLCVYGVDKYVCFDLGMLSKYQYYTGVIFRAYTYGIGEAIAKGGRYDNLLEKFGKKAAAIGYVLTIDQIMSALREQHIEVAYKHTHAIIVYEEKSVSKAIDFALDIRKKGGCIELIPSTGTEDFKDYISFIREGLVDEIYYANDGKIIKKK